MKLEDIRLGRRVLLAGASAAVLVGLSACAGASGDASGTASQRTITVATSNDPPISFTEPGSEALKGIDGDMITAIAEAKGWKIKVFTTDFNTLISALESKKADVIVDAMYITEERKKKINFTDPWYMEGEGMVVPSDSSITNRDQVKGAVAGTVTGSVYVDFVNTLGARDVKLFDSQAALLGAVANKQVDAGFMDSVFTAYSLQQNPNPNVKIVSPYTPHFPGIIGAGVRQDDSQLLADLNSGLAELKKSPKYLEILKKYGLGPANAK